MLGWGEVPILGQRQNKKVYIEPRTSPSVQVPKQHLEIKFTTRTKYRLLITIGKTCLPPEVYTLLRFSIGPSTSQIAKVKATEEAQEARWHLEARCWWLRQRR